MNLKKPTKSDFFTTCFQMAQNSFPEPALPLDTKAEMVSISAKLRELKMTRKSHHDPPSTPASTFIDKLFENNICFSNFHWHYLLRVCFANVAGASIVGGKLEMNIFIRRAIRQWYFDKIFDRESDLLNLLKSTVIANNNNNNKRWTKTRALIPVLSRLGCKLVNFSMILRA